MSQFDFVTTGDPHLCIDVQCPAGRHPETFYDEQRKKLAFIKDYCVRNKINHYLIAGDLLNYKSPSAYTPASINSLMHELASLKEQMELISISGNHDLKMSSREMKPTSVYNIFARAGVLHDVNHKTVEVAKGVTVSGIDFNPDPQDLMREVSELNESLSPKDYNIVLLHEHLLPDGETLPFGKFISYMDFMDFQNIKLIVAGHLHKGYPTETLNSFDLEAEEDHELTIVNPWSMTRLARDHYALDGTHKPELVHVRITDGKLDFAKHIDLPAQPFDVAFIKDNLVSEEKREMDISAFVTSLSEFGDTKDTDLDMTEYSDAVKEKIKHYLELAEQEHAS